MMKEKKCFKLFIIFKGQSYADDLVEEVASGVVPQEIAQKKGVSM